MTVASAAASRPFGPSSRRLGAGLARALAVIAIAAAGCLTMLPGSNAADACLHATAEQGMVQTPSMARLAPARAWWLTRGEGVIVAVLGSGVDGHHPQLFGALRPGRDLLKVGIPTEDCDGSGTFVAGLVAARPNPATAFVGIAPRAQILPIRTYESTEGNTDLPDPDLMAGGIDFAVAHGAHVIVIYRSTDRETPALRQAVHDAVGNGVVIVAGGVGAQASSDGDAFPCHYPEVVAVAGVDSAGSPLEGSCPQGDVDVSAPASQVASLGAGGHGQVVHLSADDPGLAAGFVAGAAALLVSSRPGISPSQVLSRLRDTADPTQASPSPKRTGGGMVNPYAALTVLRRTPAAPASSQPAPVPVPRPRRTREFAPFAAAAALLGGGACLALVLLAFRKAAGRKWRPGDV